MHVNTYPQYSYNEYEVQNWYELAENGVYMKTCYAILPQIDLAEKKKKKFMKVMIILTEMMKKMYVDEDMTIENGNLQKTWQAQPRLP